MRIKELKIEIEIESGAQRNGLRNVLWQQSFIDFVLLGSNQLILAASAIHFQSLQHGWKVFLFALFISDLDFLGILGIFRNEIIILNLLSTFFQRQAKRKFNKSPNLLKSSFSSFVFAKRNAIENKTKRKVRFAPVIGRAFAIKKIERIATVTWFQLTNQKKNIKSLKIISEH